MDKQLPKRLTVGYVTEFGTRHPNTLYDHTYHQAVAQVYGMPLNTLRETIADDPRWQFGLAMDDRLALAYNATVHLTDDQLRAMQQPQP